MIGFTNAQKRLLATAIAVVATMMLVSPASAQPQARPAYVVFFDFEVTGLTAAAEDVVGLAVKKATAEGAKSIVLVGHADGAEHHPERLSFKRARSVRDALLGHGLGDAIAISVQGRGFYKPLVATREREPQNRLVEIIISDTPLGQSADATPAPDATGATDAPGNAAADGFYLVLAEGESDSDVLTIPDANAGAPPLRLKRVPLVSGTSIASATATADASGRVSVAITLTSSGSALMADATSTNVGRRLAIVADGAVISAPTIETPILGGKLDITGAWTLVQATAMASHIQKSAAR